MSLAFLPTVSAPTATRAACDVLIVRDSAVLAELEQEWNALYAASPTAAPPLSWAWVSGWWRHYGSVYGQNGTGLRVLTVRRGAQLVGVLPLYQGRLGAPVVGARRLGFVSTGEAEFEGTYPEYLDLLHAPGEADTCVTVLAPVLLHSHALRWDELHLYELSATSPLLALAHLLPGGGRHVSVSPAGTCAFADTTGGFEEYLKRLSSENRRQARKMMRDADKHGAQFELAELDQVDAFFDQLLDLHRRRWMAAGEAGAFAPRHARFHQELARTLVPRGDAVLARLTHGGKPLAVVYGYRTRDKLHCYQQGVDSSAGPLRSPGTTVWLLLMQRLEAAGVRFFDHQKGKTPFKERFCPARQPMVDLRVVRPTPRALTHFVSDLTWRAARKGWRLLSERVRHATPAPAAESESPLA